MRMFNPGVTYVFLHAVQLFFYISFVSITFHDFFISVYDYKTSFVSHRTFALLIDKARTMEK